MAKIQDIRHRTQRTNGTRSLSQIKYIVRHHSATPTGDFDTFWKHWHGTKGWGTGGYHEIILRDGTVQLCYDPNEITNGVGNYNTPTYHICLVGNGSFTAAQEKAWDERVAYNMKRLGIGVNNVKGHREMPGANTTCPGINMDTVRSRIKGGTVKPSKPTPSKPNTGTTKAKLVVDGYWGRETTKALQRALGTVADGEIWGQVRNQATQAITGGVKFGSGGSPMIRALQKKVNSKADGYLGANTIRSLQRYLKTPADGELWKPSTAVKEMQRRLNAGTF